MENRSFRLSPEDVELERVIFEAYGIVDGSTTDKYRNLIRFLTENYRKTNRLTPQPKHTKPDCINLTEPEPSKYNCVFRRENKPPHILKNIHLINCTSCQQQKHHIFHTTPTQTTTTPPTINPTIKTGGEIYTIPKQQATTNNNSPVANTPIYTPNPAFNASAVNYLNDKLQRICPFIMDTKNWLIHYQHACPECRKKTPQKNQACINLCHTLRTQIINKALTPTNTNNTQKERNNYE
jgi:hypothetical protein